MNRLETIARLRDIASWLEKNATIPDPANPYNSFMIEVRLPHTTERAVAIQTLRNFPIDNIRIEDEFVFAALAFVNSHAEVRFCTRVQEVCDKVTSTKEITEYRLPNLRAEEDDPAAYDAQQSAEQHAEEAGIGKNVDVRG